MTMFKNRGRPTFTSGDIEAQLAQITIDPANTGNTENLEPLAPLVKTLQDSGTAQAYFRTLDTFVQEKEHEIERICNENYEDFASAIGMLGTVRQGTGHLKGQIGQLDGQIGQVGQELSSKKRALLQHKKVARNIDEAIDTLQTCLRVLDMVNSVKEMITSKKYFGALRALEGLRALPPSSISSTPFYQQIMLSIPLLRTEIKASVTAEEKAWLLGVRESSPLVGKLALDQMEVRAKKWKTKMERDGNVKEIRIGSAIELVNNEKSEFNPLHNEKISLDFKPLLQCIHIYEALNSRAELQQVYHADRQRQAHLILSTRGTITPQNISTILPGLMEDLVGFFIIEQHVLKISRTFRTVREVDDLWDEMSRAIVAVVSDGLKGCEDSDTFLAVKLNILRFEQTLEGYNYDVSGLTRLIMTMFERYSDLLHRKFSADFDQIVMEDDNQPMMVQNQAEFEQVVAACWLAPGEEEHLAGQGFPQLMPFSQTFPMCCINVRNFVDQFYHFVEGVTQRHRNIDELLRKSLDGLLISHVSKNICNRLSKMSNLSQIAQAVVNLEHFATAAEQLETALMTMKYSNGHQASSSAGSVLTLQSSQSFQAAIDFAQNRIDTIIASKLDEFFEMAEYDWTPPLPASIRKRGVISGTSPSNSAFQNSRPGSPAVGTQVTQRQSTTMQWFDANTTQEPSTYLFEMITFLTAYVDSVLIMLNEDIKTRTYRMALEHVNKGLLGYLIGPDVPKLNEQALKNLVDDVTFIEKEVKRLEKPGLDDVFDEIKSIINLILSEAVQAYMEPSIRQGSYAVIRPKHLQIVLEKLGRYVPDPRNMTTDDAVRMTRRRREAEMVARLVNPGR
ncbi:hypothetical protein QFC22_006353 [Naganishia vaughanmartiniae]|uniref:Uncharacterized protein n=1 Tax=Naganishia vaughanmartiniae TaxID=1424756 RepID=A0ACC2WJZ5_9TREE|nr:hypothetical protein QFC22_006353 [Naganishia vaughanmartiniae]